MMESNIIDGNKLIDQFAPEITKKLQWNIPEHIAQKEGLKYHTSWDWLMPVVEKIENTLYLSQRPVCKITYKECSIYVPLGYQGVSFTTKLHIKNTKIEAAYITVIEFITWYNNNPQPS